ncbi:MAG: hypothetical protein ACFFE6_03855 [Candidatus Thorarchaeota archaeon]
MIFVVLACIIAWNRQNNTIVNKTLRITIIAVLVTGLVAITSGSFPIVEIPAGSNQELRVMPPSAYPFTMQQYRDYDTNQFYYRIVIGWPDGLPIFQSLAMDDQSEFINLTHLYIGVLLGEYIVTGSLMVIAGLVFFEQLKRIKDQVKTSYLSGNYLLSFIISLAILSISIIKLAFPMTLSFLPSSFLLSQIILDIGFWAIFMALGVYVLFLFLPKSRQPQHVANGSLD